MREVFVNTINSGSRSSGYCFSLSITAQYGTVVDSVHNPPGRFFYQFTRSRVYEYSFITVQAYATICTHFCIFVRIYTYTHMRARCARLFRYCCYCWGNNRPSIGCSGTMYLFRCGQRCSIDRQKSRDFSKLRAPGENYYSPMTKPFSYPLIQWGGVILMYSNLSDVTSQLKEYT